MFRPFLVVGIGGSGGKTVRALRQGLQFKLDQLGWDGGWPEAWQILHIDSPTTPDGLSFPAPLLPQDDYLSLVPNGVGYEQVHNSIVKGLGQKDRLEVERPLPSPAEVKIPISLGAGKVRAVGRTIAVAGMDDIHKRARVAISQIQSATAIAELSQITQMFGAQVANPSDPTVIIISSVAGGSGAGMFIDVAEAIKASIGNAPWAFEIFSLLFTPDVFQELGDDLVSTMVPNTMTAVSELLSGYWRNNPTQGTLALYKKHGLNVPQDVKSTIGPAYNYIIGRKTSGAQPVDFDSQDGLYKALATSVAAWMTDPTVQDDIASFAFQTFLTDSRNTLDTTGTSGSHGLPLSSLGFSRVSIGTDRFAEYASERIAKQALETILNQHLVQDGAKKIKTEAQWIEHFAETHEGAFLADSGLYELTEANNQVIEALHPSTIELQTQLKSAITTAVSHGMQKGGHSFEKWVALIGNAFDVNISSLLDDLAKLRHENARAWVQEMPQKLLRLVSVTTAQQGLPVTANLLSRLLNQTREAARELLVERDHHLREASELKRLVSQALGPASSMTSIPLNHPAVAQAFHQAELAFHHSGMADLRQDSSELLLDLADNLLHPLEKTVAQGLAALRSSTSSQKLANNAPNPYAGWPEFSEKKVDKRFNPAPNESMLIDTSDFPREFDALIEESINDANLTASKAVIEQVVAGSFLDEISKLPENKQWRIFSLKQIWIPKNRSFQVRQSSGQPAVFNLVTDHMEFLSIARKWMMVPGRAFKSFVDLTITEYLKANNDLAMQSERGKKFAAGLEAAIQSSDPLVDLDQSLLLEAHGAIGEKRAICSGIPIDNSSPLKAGIDQVLVANNYKPDSGWYSSGSKAANAKSIDIFTQMTTSISAVPMVSIFEPILRQWKKSSGDYSGRLTFLDQRRSRSLPEFIPAHETQWQTMLSGWFVGRLLNQLNLEKDSSSYDSKGPKLSVWMGPGKGMGDFPFPLLSAGIVKQIDDMPAAVLESMIIAMAYCHDVGSLEPLAPYLRLFELGGGHQDQWSDLSNWVLEGKVAQNSPVPLVERAGDAEMSPQGRQDACAAYLEDLLTKFREKMVALDSHADSRTYPIAWELRSEIEYALDTCIKAVRSIEPEEEL